jgi:ferrous iron transport protein A
MEFATDPSALPGGARSLATLHKGDRGTVARVLGDDAEVGDGTGATIVMRLIEIGFVPGETVEVVAEVRPGSDPIAVRVGGTCFALRRCEVESVIVQLETGGTGCA